MKIYRFKTKEELISEFGDNWSTSAFSCSHSRQMLSSYLGQRIPERVITKFFRYGSSGWNTQICSSSPCASFVNNKIIIQVDVED
jgi:hypothetical protein